MKRIISNLLRKLAGTKKMQKIYETLFRVALSGMNYGNGGDLTESGELNVLKIVKEKFNTEILITIFDVGGNVGNYSKSLSDVFNDKAIIHAFEPSKKTFEIFLTNTVGIKNIIPNNFGLSDSETDLVLYSNAEASQLASLYQRNMEHFGLTMDISEKIKLSTIDNYCQKNNISHIHFLKLDIEGHELTALKGARQMIANKKIDLIQFEFGGCNIDSRTYFQDFFYLLKGKYRIYRIIKDGLVEISQYKETNEVFITINYLAERLD
jgi:FkbM family methyltransferase